MLIRWTTVNSFVHQPQLQYRQVTAVVVAAAAVVVVVVAAGVAGVVARQTQQAWRPQRTWKETSTVARRRWKTVLQCKLAKNLSKRGLKFIQILHIKLVRQPTSTKLLPVERKRHPSC